MRRKKKTIECIEYLSVSAPLDKVDHLEDKFRLPEELSLQ